MAADPHIRSLRVLAGIRRRRGSALEKELAQQRAELARALGASQAARDHRDECIQAHGEALLDRSRLLDQAFTPAHVRAADLEIETRLARTGEAEKAVKRCESVDHRQQQIVLTTQAALKRNQERLERFDARIAAALLKKQADEEESADEEAEEMAAARIGARRKAAAEDTGHV